jgi:long-subunit fatty acid transport protein
LKLGAGARAASLGNAYAGISDDSTAVYWNPAGLTQLNTKAISVTHSMLFEGIYYDWVSCVKPLDNGQGILGIGVQYLSYGTLKETDSTGLEIGNFKPNDASVSLSYARKIGVVSTGINLKYITSVIKNAATAFAVDLGGMYDGIKIGGNKLKIGVAVQNVGTKMKFVDQEEKLPLNVKAGVAYDLKNNWLVAVDVNSPIDGEVNVGAGTEYVYKVKQGIEVAGRAGYSTVTKDVGGLNGLTAGLGLAYEGYSLDYAFVPFGDLGDTHRLSFGIRF